MHLRSGKSMARASSSSSQPSSQAQSLQATTPFGDLNVSTAVGATMAMPVSTETGVIAPSTISTSSLYAIFLKLNAAVFLKKEKREKEIRKIEFFQLGITINWHNLQYVKYSSNLEVYLGVHFLRR